MTHPVAVLGQIRLKSYAPTFSGTDFVCRKTYVKNRSIVGQCHALMSCWDSLSSSVQWSRGQREAELGADAHFAVYRDRTTVRFDKLLDDRQPQSVTFFS